ncbi:MAG TPA: helix-turn-helix transcriptional regulator [Streptosporangiaceae bacterium]|jgi:transcriptional regulator with XRE-family HTH domain|nr:helix-turn-helix transcriptional regulator [Streptosporangiaceae bacterium]
MTLPRSHVFAGRPPYAATIDRAHTAGRSERIWEQRRALGRRLAALRSRAGFSQWEFAPLTGYSRSTLSDAELGRHRLRREFWQRCDDALRADGALIAAYDRIEAQATAARRSARSQAQAAREEQASQRLHALLPGLPEAAEDGPGPGNPPVGDDPQAPRSVVERCPHCRQPVTVMIVPAPRTS